LPEFYIILVEPKYSGNIGAVARAMMNFDFHNLYLVKPCTLDSECYARAMHASKILEESRIFPSFERAIENLDYLVATSSIESSEKRHLRNPVLVEEFAKRIQEVEGKVGLVFGREDYGLYNEEVALCDILVKIPTSESYLSLNLSHAVSIVLYFLYVEKYIPRKRRTIGKIEKEKLFSFFSKLLDEINYPQHKKGNTEIMFKRMMGRAMPSTWEYHTLMGVLSRTLDRIRSSQC
jgi:TrmH family RNA methyltransferase